jgi:hypothetical protein
MPEPPYRALSILLRVFSLLAALGGLLLIFAEKPLIVRILLRPPEGEVSTLFLSMLKEMGGMVLMLGILLWFASRNPVRNVALVDALIVGLCILALTPLLSLWMTDIRSIYPGYLLWGRSAVRLAVAALLYWLPATACALGTYRKFLRRALAAGRDVARPDTVALWPDPRQRKR